MILICAAVATQATVTSTNTVLKHAVQNNSTVPQILIAGEQTAGVGRHGKHFASPADAGFILVTHSIRKSVSP